MSHILTKADALDRALHLMGILVLIVGISYAFDAATWWLDETAEASLEFVDWIFKGAIILMLALIANVIRQKWQHRGERVFEEDSVLIPLMHKAAMISFASTIVVLQLDNMLGRVLPSEDVSLVTRLIAAWMLIVFSVSFLLMSGMLNSAAAGEE